ncbi:MAG TPA: acyltransferase family protein [Gaiellaceae bacterium]|nr:acyltransferase family protein [Gaiellaceae bacterium]
MPHRDDIQGLRAVAVLLVVLAHAGVPFLAGGFVGVDVFFVLSGFLITGILLAEAEARGRISLLDFYVRRARRILPAAALTLVVTDVAAHHLLNFVRAREAVSDSLWAAAFGANIHFAREGSDYFAQGQPPSPILHFWSLSVEEQFYLVWPGVLALVVCVLAFRRRGLLAVVATAAAASLAWSILETRSSPVDAYFSTFARAWELALGAALAVVLPRLQRWRLAPLGWLGLAAVAAAAVCFSRTTAFPGYAALLPAAGAASLIAAGASRSRFSPAPLLATAPLRYVGDRSYSFYLWHWPVLVIAAQYAGHEFGLGTKLLLVLGAFGLSIVSYGLVENPIRRLRLNRPVGALLWPASAGLVLVLSLVILRSIGTTAERFEAAAAAVKPPALVETASAATVQPTRPLPAVVAAVRAAEQGAPLPSPLTPPVDRLRGDFYTFPDSCTPSRHGTSSKVCRLGAAGAAKTIVVFGDSHAEMWMPAILAMARHDGWAVVPLVKVRCVPRSWGGTDECGKWSRWARRRAEALRPDVTLVIGSRAGTVDPLRSVGPIAAMSRALKRFSASVIVIGDSPSQTRDPVDCLLARGATMKTCTGKGTRVQARAEAAVAANARRDRVAYVDTRPWFCAHASSTTLLCPMVVNQTIACVDRGHVSRTYALELAPLFRTAFRRALFR